MERGFQSLLLAGKYGAGDGDFSPFQISDETRTYNNKSVLPSPNYPLHDIHSSTDHTRFNFKRLKHEHSTPSFTFNHLPELRSLEELKQEEENRHILQKFSTPPAEKLPYAEVAYRRRQTVSEKTRKLQKLLPVDKKMDIATVYEETYNYIQFLKAQISALESMPVECTSTSGSNFRSGNNPRYILGELNRQQLLLNSQSVMYSKRLCVYSIEQLMMFTNNY
ncbi:transcription factor bHLH117 [Bidens hawaiensis]|uniref:transcription factor bHLH117 n=1 Tax=Bidens hawaiensis TaxID=980011 RepID=UPI00404AAE8D